MAYRKRHEAEKGPSLHERITQKIVDELKEGQVPWIKPWSCTTLVRLPRNYVSGRPYSGINVLLTWLSAPEHGFTDTRWLTANQISELGGTFKGQTATRILFAKSYTRAAGTAEEETFFVHKGYNVFNVEQVGGVALEPEEPPPPFEARLEHAEAFVTAQGVPITHGGDRAFYSPSKDAINLPFPGSFTSPASYYAVALHELAHASGHPRRLNRPKGAKGSPEYAAEELVAELTAAFLCAELGIPAALHHTGYIGFWVELLENDPKAIFSASREASRAAEFLSAQARSVPALAEAA
jgi:antirestriction protein ArdC